VASTFDTLEEVTPLRARADSLGKEKTVREALKREQSEFAEQARLAGEITSHFDSSKQDADTRFDSDRELDDRVARLRMNAQQEKRPERVRVYQRALDSVFIGAIEQGNAALDAKNFSYAVRLYDVASKAKPDSDWAWRQLAVAYALGGKKKDALGALHKARDLAGDQAAFTKWLLSEPSLDTLRASPEFGPLTNAK